MKSGHCDPSSMSSMCNALKPGVPIGGETIAGRVGEHVELELPEAEVELVGEGRVRVREPVRRGVERHVRSR